MSDQGNPDVITLQGESTGVNGGNGGNGGGAGPGPITDRILLVGNVQQPSQEVIGQCETLLDAQTAKMKRYIELNIEHALKQKARNQTLREELADPIGVIKWWDVLVVGPYQFPPGGGAPPFAPGKVIAGGELAFFFIYVVTNPAAVDLGIAPSATTVMAGKPYRLRMDTVNVTNVSAGPFGFADSVFPGFPVQSFLAVVALPAPAQGRPEIFEFNVTADVTDGYLQPMAAFATKFFDPDFDPGFPVGPPVFPHLHIEQPLRCLCYTR